MLYVEGRRESEQQKRDLRELGKGEEEGFFRDRDDRELTGPGDDSSSTQRSQRKCQTRFVFDLLLGGESVDRRE